ncbi:biotin-dependent carboxyltransferase family protein [Algoriphagus sp.]|uniref:5-oxoprolinase subunit C family protein n=1 Tax=Algoriphagus sp. TaxID=1872435 RepID=UPI00391B4979
MSKEMAIATVLKTSPGSSIQDLGRSGQAKFGIPVSGAMDLKSFAWVNHILQNDLNNAVLEISQPGFHLQFDLPTSIAIAGAQALIRLNGEELEGTNFISIKPQDVLEIGAFLTGSRLYMGVRYGFKTPKILNSRSFYQGLTQESHLSKGEKIQYFTDSQAAPILNAKAKWSSDWYQGEEIQAYPGPDFYLLKEQQRERLFSESFQISQLSNRMGLQLLELLDNKLPELPTNPVFPGTVQITSGGKILILLKDAQVTGGYPRILQLDEESQSILAQKRPGNKIRLKLKKP